jgi:hypothetical protein
MRFGQMDYEIELKGRLDKRWEVWFEGLTIITEVDEMDTPITVLSGAVSDQAALHGILAKIRDIGIPLLSVRQIGMEKEDRLSSGSSETSRQEGVDPPGQVGVHNTKDRRRS